MIQNVIDQIHQGEALAFMRELPDACVDGVVTDPPYSSGGAFRADRMEGTNRKYLNSGQEKNYAPFAGDNRDQRGFAFWCVLWLAEALRVTKPGGLIAMFSDWRQLATATDTVQAGGWVFRGIFVWDKSEASRPITGRFRNQAEYVVWGSKGAWPIDPTAPAFPGVLRCVVNANEKYHTTGKPVDLMRMLVQPVKRGGVVLDPFAGSGSTCLAAALEGRRFIGCEITPEYCQVARRRIAEVQGQAVSEQKVLF